MVDKPDTTAESKHPIKSHEFGESGIAFPVSHSPQPIGQPKAENPPKSRQYGKQIIVLLIATSGVVYLGWRTGWRNMWEFLDRHNGSISAMATVAIVVLTLFYVTYSKRQWETMQGQLDQMKTSNDLVRQQLIGSQAAIANIRFNLQLDNYKPALFVVIENAGGVTATHIRAAFDVVTRKEPSRISIGPPQHFDIDIPQVAAHGNDTRTYSLVGLTQGEWRALQQSTKDHTLAIVGEFSFENGFAQKFDKKICQVWFAHPPLGNSSDQGWIDCSQYDAKLKFWADLEKEEAEKNNKKE